MSRNALTDEMRRFILTSIPSVPYLEALLLMRTAPDAGWDIATVAPRLYVAEARAAELLSALRNAGIAEEIPPESEEPGRIRYRYHPASVELAGRLDGLAQAYAEHLVTVTDLIHSRLDKRAQQFAEAFRLRKDS